MPHEETQRLDFMAVRSVDAAARTVTAYASTGNMDRHGTIIEPGAFKATMPEFMRNPVVQAAHVPWYESGDPPVIGKVVNWSIDTVGLLVTIEFAQTRIAEEYWQLYLHGFMRALSVGFRAVAREMRPRPDGSGEFEVFTEVELLEISAVSVPSNRESLVTRGLHTGDAGADDERMIRDATMRLFGDINARVNAPVNPDRSLVDTIKDLDEESHDMRAVIAAAAKQSSRTADDLAAMALEIASLRARLDEHERDINTYLAGPSRPTERDLAAAGGQSPDTGSIAGLGM